MDTGPADDAVYLALTFGLTAALTVTLWLRSRLASPGPDPTPAAGRPPAAPAGAPHRLPPPPTSRHLATRGVAPGSPGEGRHMDATRDREPGPGRTEIEALCVWTAARLRALTWAAFVGDGYDPDVYDIALLTHRAARACAAAARRAEDPQSAPAA